MPSVRTGMSPRVAAGCPAAARALRLSPPAVPWRAGLSLVLLAGLLSALAAPRALAADGHGGEAPAAAKPAPRPAAKPAAGGTAAAPGAEADKPAEGEKSIKPQIKPPLGAAVEAAKKEAEAARAAQARAAGRAPATDTSLDQLRERLNQRVQAVRDAHATTPVVRVPAGTLRPPTRTKAAEASGGAHRGTAHLHWDYTGPGGPEAWGSLKPEFATCANGERQSPIDIRGGIAVDLEPIRFEYHPSDVAVIDTGHTVQVNVPPGNRITVSGRSFDLVQFHFHRPSEERVNGRQFEMVAHLVHRDFEGRLAVVAVLLERGPANPVVQAVWNDLPLEKQVEQPSTRPMDIEALLPSDRRYYTYMGSMTTPPCNEGVLWLVLKNPSPLSQEQIGVFARLYPMNARPVQRNGGRLIKESN